MCTDCVLKFFCPRLQDLNRLLSLSGREIRSLGGRLLAPLAIDALSLASASDLRTAIFAEVAALPSAEIMAVGDLHLVTAVADAYLDDLTSLFGAGNEATTASHMGNLLLYATDAARILDVVVDALLIQKLDPVCLPRSRLLPWSDLVSDYLSSEEERRGRRRRRRPVFLSLKEMTSSSRRNFAGDETFLRRCRDWMAEEEEEEEAFLFGLMENSGGESTVSDSRVNKARPEREKDGDGGVTTDELYEAIRAHWNSLYAENVLTDGQKEIANRVFRSGLRVDWTHLINSN